jgi:hypothetical protein
MDLLLNKLITYDALDAFLQEQYAAQNFFLLYPDVNEWDDVEGNGRILQYRMIEAQEGPFTSGISLFIEAKDLLPILENLAFKLSTHFDCGVMCDASRILLNQRNIYFSLLFEQNRIYLVDDRWVEESGTVMKIVSLNYELPPDPLLNS